jgi:hypothetical protein
MLTTLRVWWARAVEALHGFLFPVHAARISDMAVRLNAERAFRREAEGRLRDLQRSLEDVRRELSVAHDFVARVNGREV